MNISTEIYKKVYICHQKGKVYLVNQLAERIESLKYSTFSMLTDDERIGVSSAPTYSMENIPKGHAIYLETLDGWEDGSIYYQLKSLKTANINFNEELTLKEKKLSGMLKLPPLANVVIEKISTENAFTIDISKNTINQLYWLAEELQSYTDLTGNRFDTENAQRRLFPMASHLKTLQNDDLQSLYDEMLEQLEMPAFFNKNDFSTKVDKFYGMIERLR